MDNATIFLVAHPSLPSCVQVVADGVLINSQSLTMDEASLSRETDSVRKSVKGDLWVRSGTQVCCCSLWLTQHTTSVPRIALLPVRRQGDRLCGHAAINACMLCMDCKCHRIPLSRHRLNPVP